MKKQNLKIKIRKWILFTEFGMNVKPYIVDTSDWGISNEEISINIQEQIYGDKQI